MDNGTAGGVDGADGTNGADGACPSWLAFPSYRDADPQDGMDLPKSLLSAPAHCSSPLYRR